MSKDKIKVELEMDRLEEYIEVYVKRKFRDYLKERFGDDLSELFDAYIDWPSVKISAPDIEGRLEKLEMRWEDIDHGFTDLRLVKE